MNLNDAFSISKEKGRTNNFEIISPSPEDLHIKFNYKEIGDLEVATLKPNEQDFNKVVGFYKGLFPDTRMRFGPPDRFMNPIEEDINILLGHYPNHVFIKPEGNAVGIFYLMKHGEKIDEKPELENPVGLGIGVADQYQGCGLGSLGMDILEALAYHGKHDAIWLENFTSNKKA